MNGVIRYAAGISGRRSARAPAFSLAAAALFAALSFAWRSTTGR
jgi:hypothetical protein